MKSDKKGQFYLLAAIVIVSVIIGFAAITNMVQKSGTIRLGDTGKELGIESGKVLEYGAVKNANSASLVEHFTNSYDEYAGENKQIFFIVGNGRDLVDMNPGDCFCDVNNENEEDCKDSLRAYSYDDLSRGTILNPLTSRSSTTVKITDKFKRDVPICKVENNEINITVDGIEYPFEVKPGENFYFVLKQDVGGEQYVVTG